MFFIIVILIIWFLFWISSPNKKPGVILYFANIGTGKTTFLSKIAIREQKRMRKGKSKYKYILSNALISGVSYVEDIRKLMKQGAIQDTLLLIDEGSIVYNNRKMNLTEIEILWFKLIRHYGCSTIVLSQSYDDIDVTLRRLYTQIYVMKWLPFFTLIKPIKKIVDIDDMSKQIIDAYKFKWLFSYRLFLRPLYFKFFNSWWIPSDIPILDLSKIEKQPEYVKRSIKDRFFKLHKMKELNDETLKKS